MIAKVTEDPNSQNSLPPQKKNHNKTCMTVKCIYMEKEDLETVL